MIYIDITDTLDVVARKGYVTGIQRVATEIIRHRTDVCPIAFSRTARCYQIVPSAIIAALLIPQQSILQTYRRKSIWRKLGGLLQTPLILTANDTVFLPGLSWVQHRIRDTLKQTHARIIIFMHDMIPFDYPEFVVDAAFVAGFRAGFNDITPHVDKIITNSQETAKRVRTYLKTPLPIDIAPLAHEHIAPTLNRPAFDDNNNYVLCVGTIEVRKNHAALVTAWRALAKSLDHVPTLMFAGGWGWGVEALRQELAASNNLDGKLRIIENPDDATLAGLYKHARFSICPSHYEGWGLPVGESLWHGTPVVISDKGALPEVHNTGIVVVQNNLTATLAALLSDTATLKSLRQSINPHTLRTWQQFAVALNF